MVDLPIAGTLPAGTYRLRLTGRASGASSSQRVEQPLTFASGGTGGSPAVSPNDGLTQQKVVVDWSGGKFSGREVGGFVAPGIGHGEILCRPDAQWIRFFPNEQSREVAMMNWTYKDWGGDHEKSLREALHTSGTGPDFREGFNKFSPTEKHSTGQYDGIISDRGVIGGAGGDSLAPPTTLHLTWEWDMSKTGGERCHVEATFTTQASGSDTPLARSVQVGWRGDANAAGRDIRRRPRPGERGVALRGHALRQPHADDRHPRRRHRDDPRGLRRQRRAPDGRPRRRAAAQQRHGLHRLRGRPDAHGLLAVEGQRPGRQPELLPDGRAASSRSRPAGPAHPMCEPSAPMPYILGP